MCSLADSCCTYSCSMLHIRFPCNTYGWSYVCPPLLLIVSSGQYAQKALRIVISVMHVSTRLISEHAIWPILVMHACTDIVLRCDRRFAKGSSGILHIANSGFPTLSVHPYSRYETLRYHVQKSEQPSGQQVSFGNFFREQHWIQRPIHS